MLLHNLYSPISVPRVLSEMLSPTLPRVGGRITLLTQQPFLSASLWPPRVKATLFIMDERVGGSAAGRGGDPRTLIYEGG